MSKAPTTDAGPTCPYCDHDAPPLNVQPFERIELTPIPDHKRWCITAYITDGKTVIDREHGRRDEP